MQNIGEDLVGERMLMRWRSEEHTSELQSQSNLVCRLLLEKKKNIPSRFRLLSIDVPARRSDGLDLAAAFPHGWLVGIARAPRRICPRPYVLRHARPSHAIA